MNREMSSRVGTFPFPSVPAPKTAHIAGLDLDALYNAPQRQKILIIEDDPDTLTLLKEVMRMAGYDVIGAGSANEALRKTLDVQPDLIMLDLMMPEVDGWQTFQYLQEVTKAPVVIVSARTEKTDIVKGLQLGVDDYVTKPFFNEEVVARVKAVLRRSKGVDKPTTRVFPNVDLKIDFDTQEVTIRGKPVQLTNKEFAVLAILARHAPRNVHYETIANEIWGEDTGSVRKRIKYLIYLLRRKLEVDSSNPQLILNAEAIGYKLQTTGR